MEALPSSETPVLTRATWRNIPYNNWSGNSDEEKNILHLPSIKLSHPPTANHYIDLDMFE
jgi:hypothetical protein